MAQRILSFGDHKVLLLCSKWLIGLHKLFKSNFKKIQDVYWLVIRAVLYEFIFKCKNIQKETQKCLEILTADVISTLNKEEAHKSEVDSHVSLTG